ncbi:MAG: ABC transporter ATP-binding protein [Eubacterium sp.]|nr:ABC transporter ATP-binding protein [Eubacterium sp.]
MKATYKRILKCIKKYRLLVILSLISAAATVVLQLYIPILAGRAVDHVIGVGNVDYSAVKDILTTMIIVIAGAAISQWIMSILNNKITYNIVKDIRTEAYNHMETLPLSYIDSKSYGDTVSRIVSDIDQFADGLLMGFSQLFTGVITIVGTLIFMFSVNVRISLVVVLLTPMSLIFASRLAKATFNMFKKQSEARGEMTGLVEEMIGNQKIVQAFSYEDDAEKRFEVINDELSKATLKATFFSSLTNPGTRFVNNIVYAGVGIVGAFSVIGGVLTVGQLTVFLSYATQYAKPFNEISGVMTELQNAVACAARVFEMIDEKPEISDADSEELKDVKGQVDIDGVVFSYVPDKKLITNFNLKVEQGKRVAIVGPTGCGKSTVINLLMRFYDVNKGCISVDGKDIRKVTRNSLRDNYGMVLQETWLKTGTVRENIAYGKPDATDEEIIAAAKLTHAHSFIRRLPKGYDTELIEDGGILSQGQKQLLCITRVVLNLPPMLILDEATSSIDTRTEIRIQNAFAKMMQGRTSFIVAHRLSTIQSADLILVMKDGNIIEQGTHTELLEKKGFYSELYNAQYAN